MPETTPPPSRIVPLPDGRFAVVGDRGRTAEALAIPEIGRLWDDVTLDQSIIIVDRLTLKDARDLLDAHLFVPQPMTPEWCKLCDRDQSSRIHQPPEGQP